ncbi:MAG: GNAT family N-acetyltransferase [Candidatus Omnitrophica bacterium]|nr:GNAT family N-acetyltransferase [Candidatus Omnitrophota bacterium]
MKLNSNFDIKVRSFRDADKPQVIKLINSILKNEFSISKDAYSDFDINNINDVYGGKRDLFLVAVTGSSVVGTIAIKEDDKNSALLRRVFVAPEFRGIGLGKKLIVKAIEFCENNNYSVINFCSTDKMQAANELCKKNGFKRRACMTLGVNKLLKFTRRIRNNKR